MLEDVEIYTNDANAVIRDLCNKNWIGHRAIMFLDPFGMEVKWSSLEAIAKTEAIDLWILFPLGVSVNRMLMKNRDDIPKNWSNKLDSIFGTDEWLREFYSRRRVDTLFGEEESVHKTANFDMIANYYIKRLKEIFAGVVQEPMYLYNATNNPIFLLCFASGNEKGSKTAVKIAKDIMAKELRNSDG